MSRRKASLIVCLEKPDPSRQRAPRCEQQPERQRPAGKHLLAIFAIACLTFVTGMTAMPAQAQENYSLSLRNVDLGDGEGIIAFRIEVTGSSSQSLHWTRNNWSISSSTVNAVAQTVGATADPQAAVKPADFRDFLVVGLQPDATAGLRVRGDLTVHDFNSNAAERHITLTPHQFDLRRLP